MPRVKRSDQLAITGPKPKEDGHRYFTGEVADFLMIGIGRLRKWALEEGCLHRYDNAGRSLKCEWLTEWGMVRAIQYFRTDVGEDQLKGTRRYRHMGTLKPYKPKTARRPWQVGEQVTADRAFWARPAGQGATYRTRRAK